jgi:hypothetical protein
MKTLKCLMAVALFTLASGAMALPLTHMTAHNAAGVTCDACHNQQRVEQNCLACHNTSPGVYHGKNVDKNGRGIPKAYPESGKTKMAAMHDAHTGPIRCTVCHVAHTKAPGKLYCNYCHQFDVKVP